MVRKGVEDLGASQDVETDKHNVIGQEHDAGEMICSTTLVEGVVAEIADVHDLRVLHDVLVHRDRSDVE